MVKIIFEDASLIVINKPAGIPVYPLKKEEKNTIANALVARYPELDDVGPPLQAGIIHRLDNDTSGILVIARNNDIYDKLRSIWNTDQVIKEYTALAFGITPDKKTISTPIAHHPSKKKKMMVCETEVKAEEFKARPAETKIKRIQIPQPNPACRGDRPVALTCKEFSLLKVNITTGVRHQIRVHLASIGHPIVGDSLYNKKRNVGAYCNTPLQRHFLHLSRVELPHPVTGEKLNLEAPLANDLGEFMGKLL